MLRRRVPPSRFEPPGLLLPSVYEAHHALLRPSNRRAPQPYNGACLTYNGVMSTSEHIMTVSQNGQVSIPAAARARWNVRRVIVVDLGDRVVVRPASDRPVADLEGKYKGRGPSSDQARRRAHRAETSRAR
jgi:AbrB family looped-hinge helix DNA binding protein